MVVAKQWKDRLLSKSLQSIIIGETGETSDTGDFGHYTQLDAVAFNH